MFSCLYRCSAAEKWQNIGWKTEMMMTPRQLVRAAMDLEMGDRVPVMCQLSIGHMLLQLDVSPAEFWFDAKVFVAGLLALREMYDFDGILVSLHGHNPEWKRDAVKIERLEEGGERVVWNNGDVTILPPNDLPVHRPASPAAPPAIGQLDPDAVASPLSYIPVSQGLHFPIDTDHPYNAIEDILEQAGESYSIHGEVTSPFDYLLDLLGHEQGLMALITHKERCLAILDRFAEGTAAVARRLAELGVDAVKISSPFAGMGFISPDFYRTFVLPFESHIVQAVRQQGIHAYLHTCGEISDRLELMVTSGASGIECLDPPPLGNVDLAEAVDRIGKSAFIKGNIDPVNLLLNGSVEDIEREVRRVLQTGRRAKGFILSTACSVAPGVPRENLKILARVAKEG